MFLLYAVMETIFGMRLTFNFILYHVVTRAFKMQMWLSVINLWQKAVSAGKEVQGFSSP